MVAGVGRTAAGRRWRRVAQRARSALLRLFPWGQQVLLPGFLLVIAGLTAGTAVTAPDTVPPSVLLVPLMASGLLLGLPAVRLVVAVCFVALAYDVAADGWDTVRVGVVVAAVVGAGFTLWLATARARLGVPGLRGEAMLLELRDKLREHGELPALPQPWHADVRLESAGGASFGGDFLVSARSDDGRLLELALVDVSGKGVEAGTRALLLSGALGGLLGAIAPEEFLAVANRYLAQQEWQEGFATASHVVVDLESGAFRVGSAGHPPVVHFDAGSGRWHALQVDGVALGVVPQASYDVLTGQLRRGDALLLYTDGVVEVPGRDLSVGVDKLLGEAERLVPRGFGGAAERLLEAMRSPAHDDRAILLLWRD